MRYKRLNKFKDSNETNMSHAKELIINAEGIESEIRYALETIEIMRGQGYVKRHDFADYTANERQKQRRKGTDSGADTGEDADRISRQPRPHSDEIGDENNGSTDAELLEGRKVSTVDRSENGLREQGANSEKLAGYLGVLGTDEGQVSSEHRAGESGWLVRQKNSQSSEGRHTASILRAVSRISLSGRDSQDSILKTRILRSRINAANIVKLRPSS